MHCFPDIAHQVLTKKWSHFLPGGTLHEADQHTKEIMKVTVAENDAGERSLSQNDHITRFKPGMTQEHKSTVIKATTNRTSDWIESFGEEAANHVTNCARVHGADNGPKAQREKAKHAETKAIKRQVIEQELKKGMIKRQKKLDETSRLRSLVKCNSVGGLELCLAGKPTN